MSYQTVCKACGAESRIAQKRGLRMHDYQCVCGGPLRRVGWQEMYRLRSGVPTAAEAAAQLLRETQNTAIGWGDSVLLHAVAQRIGVPAEGPRTEKVILDKIAMTYPGALVKGYTSLPSRGLARVRRFSLPESLSPTVDGRTE